MAYAISRRMTPEQLRERITAWAVDVARLIGPLFRRLETRDRASQLKRAADSTAGNYRAACIARSHRDFLSTLSIALEEADESVGWLDMFGRENALEGAEFLRLLDEGRQISRILGKSRITAEESANRRRPRRDPPIDQ